MNRRVFGYCLLAVILASPLLLTGGNEALFTVLLGLTLLLCFLFLFKQPIDGALKVPLRLFLAFIGCQLFTLIPVPVSWIRWLSPGLYKVLLNFPEVAYHTLSWDAILTFKTLAVYIAASAVFLVACHLWEDPLEKVPFVVQLFFWVGTFWAGVSLWLHYASPGRVPFLPWQPEPWFFGLFTNSNIFGSFCAFLIPIGLALGIYRIRTWDAAPGIAPLIFVAVAAVVYALYLSGSQGAILSAGLVVASYFLPKRIISVPIMFILLVLSLARWGPTIDAAAFASLKERIAMAGIALRSVASMPILGGGLGTSGLVLPLNQGPMGDLVVNKVHNDPLELLLTAGISGLLLAVCVMPVSSCIIRYFRRKSTLRAGIVGGLMVIGAHSLVDFPLQNYTLMAGAAFSAGLVMATRERTREEGDSGGRWWFLALVGAGLVIVAFSAFGLWAVESGEVSIWQPEKSWINARGRLDRIDRLRACHGLNAMAWGERSLELERENSFLDARDSISRALSLQPWNPRLFVIRARMHFYLDERESMIKDLSQNFALAPTIALLKFPLQEDELEKIITDGANMAYTYYGENAHRQFQLGYLYLKQNNIAGKTDLICKAAELFPEQEIIQSTAASEMLMIGRNQQALLYVEKAVRLRAQSYNAVLLGRALVALGREKQGKDAFRKGLDLAATEAEASQVVSSLIIALPGLPAQESIDFAISAYHAFPSASIARIIGQQFNRTGRFRQAVEWYDKAVDLAPTDPGGYKELLPILRRIGDKPRMEFRLKQFKSYFPSDPWASSFSEQSN